MGRLTRSMSTVPTAARAPWRSTLRRWLSRLGVAGFAFFLLKGLAWLLIPIALAYLGRSK